MSVAKILAELPSISTRDRTEILNRLYELQDNDLLHGEGPTEREKQLLDEARLKFEQDGPLATRWQQVIGQLISERRW